MKTRTRGYIEKYHTTVTDVLFTIAYFILFTVIAGAFFLNPIYPITFENYQHLTPSQYIYQEAEKAGIDPVKVMMLVQAESGFDQYAVNYNPRNNSFDRGLFQINSKAHPEISKECAFSIKCSTKESLKLIKRRGFKEWSSNKYLNF